MKKKKIYINVLSAFAISSFIAGAFFILACGSNSAGEFDRDRLLISKGETFDASEYFKGKSNVEFISMDESIVGEEENAFVGVSPGLTFIYSVQDGVKGDYLEVLVKDSFSQPEGISLSDKGLISWNNVYSYVGDDQYVASYEICLNGEVISTPSNYYQLKEEGEYVISVRASGQEFVDPSQWGSEITLYYQKMGEPKNITFTPSSDPSSMRGKISWDKVEGARYKVVVDNISYETAETSIDVNFENLTRKSIYISVEAVDKSGKLLSSKIERVLSKLEQPKVTYSDGALHWETVDGAEKYRVIYKKGNVTKDIVTTELCTELDEVDEGVYNIAVQSISSGDFINSDKRFIAQEVVKLGKSGVSYQLGEDYVDVIISTTSNYLKNFKILNNNEEISVSIESGNSVTKRVELGTGVHEFKVQSLPTYQDDKVLPLNGSGYVVSSSYTSTTTFYVLDKAQNLKHYFDDKNNSILEFNADQNANTFKVKINGVEVENCRTSKVEDKVMVNLGVIDRSKFNIEDGKNFKIELLSKRALNTIGSTTEKEIFVHSTITSMNAEGEDIGVNEYSWNNIENAKYHATIYRTADSEFSAEDLDPIFEGELTEAKTQTLPGGFYIIKVKTLTTDSDNYWSSNGVMEDKFIVSENEESPYFLDFYYDNSLSGDYSGYGIKFKIPEAEKTNYLNPRKYQIWIDGKKVVEAEAEETEKILTYNFASSFTFSSGSARKVELRTICSDTELAKIRKESGFAVLNIEKLTTPEKSSVSTTDDNFLCLSLQKNAKTVIYEKDDVPFIEGEEYLQKIDLSKYVGRFDIVVHYEGYKDFTTDEAFASGNFYIESDKMTITCQRDEIPSNLSYQKKVISFDHNGKAENFNLIIKIKTRNDDVGKEWKTQIGAKEYNLDDLTALLGSEFEAYYSQKVEMSIDIYSSVSKFVEDTYYISSINETEASKGMAHIEITQLENVTDLAYNKTTDKLLWSSKNPNSTTYELYQNNELIAEIDVSASEEDGVSKYEYSLSSLTTTPGEEYNFKVIATKKNSFDSNVSNTVTVKKLKSLDSIKIYTNLEDEKVYIKWDLTSEQVNLVESIQINEEMVAVTEQTGEIELPAESVQIKLISKGESKTKTQYRDSDTTTFIIKSASDEDYATFIDGTVVKKDSEDWLVVDDLGSSYIEWTPFEDDNAWSGEKAKVNYIFIIYKQDGTSLKIDLKNENRIQLNNSTLKSLVNGQYSFNVYARFEEYTLSDKNGASSLSKYLANTNVEIKKLADIQNIKYNIDETKKETYEEELSKKVTITWEHADASDDVYYNIQFLNAEHSVVYAKAVQGKQSLEIALDEIATLGVKYLNIFAYSTGNLFSNSTEIQVGQNEEPSATLSDNGILTVNSSSASARYIIKGEIAGETYNYILDGKQNIDIYNCFKLSDLVGEIKGQKEELTLSIISVGNGQTFPSEKKEIIQKEILGQGTYDVYAGYIFFRNEFASKVHVLYEEGGEIKEDVLSSQQILYRAGNNESYTYFAPNSEYLVVDESQYMGGFRFEIPASWKGETRTFTYYFETEDMGNSWTDLSLKTNSKQLKVGSAGEISDIQFSMAEETNNISATLDVTSEKVFMEVTREGEILLYGYVYKNEIPIWNIEENLSVESLPEGEYNFKVWNIQKNENGETSFSAPYEFVYEKKANLITNTAVVETGYYEWEDGDDSSQQYLIECGDKNFVVKERKFDLNLLEQRSFTLTIKKIYDIPFGGSVKLSELGGKVITVTNPTTISSEDIAFSDPCEFVEITEDAVVVLKVPGALDYRLFMDYAEKTYEITDFTKDYGSINYLKIREIDLIDTLGENFATDITSVNFSITEEGKVKSPSTKVDLNLVVKSDSRSITQRKAGNLFDEYLIYASDLGNIERAVLRIKNEDGEENYDDLREVVSGYWVTMENTETTGFYTELPDSYVSYESVKVIKIGELLNELEMPNGATWTVEVAPIHNDAGISQVQWLSTVATYYRLLGISKVGVNEDGTKVTWVDNDRDAKTSSYFVRFDKVEKYISSDTYEIAYTEFTNGIFSDLEIYAISKNSGELYSIKSEIKNIGRNDTISGDYVELNEGIMSLNWGSGLTEEETKALISSATMEETRKKILQSGDFLKILGMRIKGIYGDAEFKSMIVDYQFKLPISFTLGEIKNEKIEIKFVKGGQEKSATVSAVQLLQKLDSSYIECLKNLNKTGTVNSGIADFVNIFGSTTKSTGIACDDILFDEIGGNVGYNVEAGEYEIQMSQLGNPNRPTLKSDGSVVMENTEVVAVPEIMMASDDITNNEGKILTSKYSIQFKPVGTIEKYRILFRRAKGGTFDQAYYIEKNAGVWKLYYSDADGEKTFELTALDNGFVKIPMNSIGDQVGIDTIILEKSTTKEFSVYIYACGQGNQFNSKTCKMKVSFLEQNNIYVNNGQVNFAVYRDSNENIFDSYVIYATSDSSNYNVSVLKKIGSIVEYLPESNGEYTFVAFHTRGKIKSSYTMYIDSPIYMMENVFKLYDPTVNVVDGKIVIDENSKNDEVYSEETYQRIYTISNDISVKESVESLKTGPVIAKQYVYEVGESRYEGSYDAYKLTEKLATKFYIQNNGSNGGMTAKDNKTDATLGNVKILKFTDTTKENQRVIFQSSSINISARMLADIEVNLNEEGDFVWNEVVSSNDEELSSSTYKIVYKVEIDYCKVNGTDEDSDYPVLYSSSVFYTTGTTYSSKLLDNPEDAEKYKYRLRVSAMYYDTSGLTEDVITTLEGKTFYIIRNGVFDDELSKILRSNEGASEKFERLPEITDLTISGGAISWSYKAEGKDEMDNKFLFYASLEKDSKNKILLEMNNTNTTIATANGRKNYVFTPTTTLQQNTNYYLTVKVVRDDKHISSVETAYGDTFTKLPDVEVDKHIEIKENISEGTAVLDFTSYKESLSSKFQNAFKLKIGLTINDEVRATNITLLPSGNLKLTLSGNSKYSGNDDKTNNIYYINPKQELIVKLDITPMVNEQKNIISGNKTYFEFTRASWSILDEVVWDSDKKEFKWSYGKKYASFVKEGEIVYKYNDINETYEEVEDFEYKAEDMRIISQTDDWIKVEYGGAIYYVKEASLGYNFEYADVSNVKFNVEIETKEVTSTTTYNTVVRSYTNIDSCEFEDGVKGGRFAPILNGTLISFTVYAKYGEKNISSTKLEYGKGSFELNCFEGGSGTVDNPYLISTADQFKLISLRATQPTYMQSCVEKVTKTTVKNGSTTTSPSTTSTKKYVKNYFKQNCDLTFTNFTGFVISGDFGGNYEGNGKNISLTGKSGDTNISLNETSQETTLTFTRGVSLFEKISNEGSVKNLNLDVNFTYSNGENTIFAGVVVTNEGEINNVVCNSFVFKLDSAINKNGGVFVSTIAGTNKGKVIDCTNKAKISVNHTKNEETVVLAISGLVSSNYGSLEGCGNEGGIETTINSSLDLRIGGVVGYNKGSLNMCYNTGTLQGNRNGSNVGGIGGLTNYTSNSTITYSFNNGMIYGGSDKCGGISYKAKNMTLNYVFAYGDVNGEVKKSKKSDNIVFNASNGSYGSASNIYSYSGSGTNISGILNLSASKYFSSGGYTINVVRNDTYSFELSLTK